MHIDILEARALAQLDVPEDWERLERMHLITAACMLMSANASLPPEDAVNDVLQVYQFVTDALRAKKGEG